MNRFRHCFLGLYFLKSAAFFLLCSASSSQAQVSAGYRNPIITSGSMGQSLLLSTKQTNLFFIEGENVVPNDNSKVFTRSTTWIIKNQANPFSLKIEDANPLIESTSVFEESRSASVSRTEILPIAVSGPAAAALRSVFPRISGPLESDFVIPEPVGF